MAGRLLPAMTFPETPMDVATNDADQRVRHFRQILMWPLQLMPLTPGGPFQNHSQLLDRPGPDNPWRPSMFETTRPGVFAVGDVRSGSVKRVAAAVGEGAAVVRLVHQFMASSGDSS